MKTLIGGAVAAVLGILGLAYWLGEFWQILKGAIPIMLLLGGALAIYLGIDELKDSLKSEKDADVPSPSADPVEVENLKKENEELKKENEELKKSSEEESSE